MALMPPVKLVDPTLATSRRGMFSGSMTTSGTLTAARASTCAPVSSPVTTMTPVRPVWASERAHERGGTG